MVILSFPAFEPKPNCSTALCLKKNSDNSKYRTQNQNLRKQKKNTFQAVRSAASLQFLFTKKKRERGRANRRIYQKQVINPPFQSLVCSINCIMHSYQFHILKTHQDRKRCSVLSWGRFIGSMFITLPFTIEQI